MIKETVIEFQKNEADVDEGLGDAGIETFSNSPYYSAAKESGQNSKDAMREGPVKMSFLLHKVKTKSLPFYNSFSGTIKQCLKRVEVSENSDEKEKDFFTNARNILDKDDIAVLEISDVNTSGLIGPCKDRTPFYSLLKGTGVSQKNSDTSNGSFGIGKDASFAISDLRTVLYSTIYIDKATGKKTFLAQGKTKLVSHIDTEGIHRKGTGWWGYKGFNAIDNRFDVPNWMDRKNVGTSVFSIGFREEEDWKYRMAAALLSTFFIAIADKDMEFNVNNDIFITSESISMHFEDPDIYQAAIESGCEEEFQFSRSLYNCYVSAESINYEKEIKKDDVGSIGNFRIRVLKQKGLPKRIGFVRNGIFITDNLKNFNHPFRQFPRYSDFIALVWPLEPKGSAILKTLENPSHDEFSANRIINEDKRKIASLIMKSLGTVIRETIKNCTQSQPNKIEALNELAEMFPLTSVNKEGSSEEQSPTILKYEVPRKTKKKKKKKKKTIVTVKNTPEQTDAPEQEERQNKTDQEKQSEQKNQSEQAENPEGNNNADIGKKLHLSDQRNINKGVNFRRILFNVNKSRLASLRVEATGLAQNTKLLITKASNGKVIDGEVQMNMETGNRVSLDICFEEAYTGPIEISCTVLGKIDEIK